MISTGKKKKKWMKFAVLSLMVCILCLVFSIAVVVGFESGNNFVAPEPKRRTHYQNTTAYDDIFNVKKLTLSRNNFVNWNYKPNFPLDGKIDPYALGIRDELSYIKIDLIEQYLLIKIILHAQEDYEKRYDKVITRVGNYKETKEGRLFRNHECAAYRSTFYGYPQHEFKCHHMVIDRFITIQNYSKAEEDAYIPLVTSKVDVVAHRRY